MIDARNLKVKCVSDVSKNPETQGNGEVQPSERIDGETTNAWRPKPRWYLSIYIWYYTQTEAELYNLYSSHWELVVPLLPHSWLLPAPLKLPTLGSRKRKTQAETTHSTAWCTCRVNQELGSAPFVGSPCITQLQLMIQLKLRDWATFLRSLNPFLTTNHTLSQIYVVSSTGVKLKQDEAAGCLKLFALLSDQAQIGYARW